MKNIGLLFIFLTLALGCKQSGHNYANKITSICNSLTEKFISSSFSVVVFNNISNAKNHRDDILKETTRAKQQIAEMGGYENDFSLQKAALDYVDFLNNITKHELSEVINLTENQTQLKLAKDSTSLEYIEINAKITSLLGEIAQYAKDADRKIQQKHGNFVRKHGLKTRYLYKN